MTDARLRFERLEAGATSRAAFERVREAVGIYAGLGPEPAPEGAAGLVAWRTDDPVARCTLTEARDLNGAPGLTGMIGHYEAIDRRAGAALLALAAQSMAERGAERVLGPMNGSTWARYRLALAPEPEELSPAPPFLLEPWNPPSYGDDFLAAGFAVVARYESREGEAGAQAADAAEVAAAVRAAGIRVRPIEVERFEQELRLLFDLSVEAFADNLYYSPLEFAAFRESYERIRPLVDPELVPIAEDAAGSPLAFQFAYVDPLAARHGVAPRAIVKTIATAKAARGRGLGGHLLDLLRSRARALGCRSVIHALMHVDNFSMRMSARHGTRTLRRYALYEWRP